MNLGADQFMLEIIFGLIFFFDIRFKHLHLLFRFMVIISHVQLQQRLLHVHAKPPVIWNLIHLFHLIIYV